MINLLARSIKLNFSHLFEGIIWNTVLNSQSGVLIVEVRNTESRQVSFSAINSADGTFLWRNKVFDEAWWISLNAMVGDIALFTVYLETDNPDKKGIFGYHVRAEGMLWWNNDFSLVTLGERQIKGVAMKYGFRNVTLNVETGAEIPDSEFIEALADTVLRPQQFSDDHPYFGTVKSFLLSTFNLSPVIALEYVEYEGVIIISLYIQQPDLTNYMLILSSEGELLMKEKLDEHLKGIGLDTFFIFAGCVFFAKNKRELFSYKIV